MALPGKGGGASFRRTPGGCGLFGDFTEGPSVDALKGQRNSGPRGIGDFTEGPSVDALKGGRGICDFTEGPSVDALKEGRGICDFTEGPSVDALKGCRQTHTTIGFTRLAMKPPQRACSEKPSVLG